MKLARTLLSILTLAVLAACGDSVTEPQARPEAAPALDCGVMVQTTLSDGTVIMRCSQLGSGG